MTLDGKLRTLIGRMIKDSQKSRSQIADELSALLSIRVTLSMLNNFTSTSKLPTPSPATWIPAFCQVTQQDMLQRLVLSETMRSRLNWADHQLDADTLKRDLIEKAVR